MIKEENYLKSKCLTRTYQLHKLHNIFKIIRTVPVVVGEDLDTNVERQGLPQPEE